MQTNTTGKMDPSASIGLCITETGGIIQLPPSGISLVLKTVVVLREAYPVMCPVHPKTAANPSI